MKSWKKVFALHLTKERKVDQKIIGYALLILDVTEREKASELRREFTANVSHELKSPLQSILGSVELLQSPFVKEEDQKKFLHHIEESSKRLLLLIEDTLKLSRLDEGRSEEKISCSMKECIQEAEEVLLPLIQQKQLVYSVEGEDFSVQAQKKVLYDIVFNLMENAVKYNKKEGSLRLLLSSKKHAKVLWIEDSGCGIAEEECDRVFERFYRADKSHSQKIEGTGLGLSIAKHAVESLGGQITLKSCLGKGTAVEVSFLH